jgi:LytR cell envelope-related transcriptional attenuator
MKRSKNSLSSALKKVIISLLAAFIIVVMVLIIQNFLGKTEDIEDPTYNFSSVKISILNGCGRKNAATEVKDFLYEKEINNLDIISWKNVARQMFIYEKSLIIVKKGNEEKLNFLMNLTGIHRRIYAENDQFIEEFQIILGKDYKQYFN